VQFFLQKNDVTQDAEPELKKASHNADYVTVGAKNQGNRERNCYG